MSIYSFVSEQYKNLKSGFSNVITHSLVSLENGDYLKNTRPDRRWASCMGYSNAHVGDSIDVAFSLPVGTVASLIDDTIDYRYRLLAIKIAFINVATPADYCIGGVADDNTSGVFYRFGEVLTTGRPEAKGTVVETFNIVLGANDAFIFAVDGGANQTVTLTPGAARTAQQVCDDINAGSTGVYALNADGYVFFTTWTKTAGSLIEVKAGNANATLGFVNDSTYLRSTIKVLNMQSNFGLTYASPSSSFATGIHYTNAGGNGAALPYFSVSAPVDYDGVSMPSIRIFADSGDSGKLKILRGVDTTYANDYAITGIIKAWPQKRTA